MMKKSLCGLTAGEILDLIAPAGFTEAHSLIVANSIYKKGISDISQIGKIPIKLKEILSEVAESGIFLPVASQISKDKSVKYLFRTKDKKEFETVFIPDKKRNTICVSTQSGCRMGCTFCATARYGFRGNLTAGEIINQIISIPEARSITHVVFMGMGEPLDNLENVLRACSIINAEWGLAVSPRNVTVSTVGLLAGVGEYLQKTECNLTLSLFSPFAEERKTAIPAENNNPMQGITELMKSFHLKKKRRISIAYVMLQDLNDTDSHLEALTALLRGSAVRVNLLPYHPVPNDRHVATSPERMQFFKHHLVLAGISASIRKSRGEDISAACGLLASGIKMYEKSDI
jgi:23S rRNA (adenine2503-C2)-methyltransferase